MRIEVNLDLIDPVQVKEMSDRNDDYGGPAMDLTGRLTYYGTEIAKTSVSVFLPVIMTDHGEYKVDVVKDRADILAFAEKFDQRPRGFALRKALRLEQGETSQQGLKDLAGRDDKIGDLAYREAIGVYEAHRNKCSGIAEDKAGIERIVSGTKNITLNCKNLIEACDYIENVSGRIALDEEGHTNALSTVSFRQAARVWGHAFGQTRDTFGKQRADDNREERRQDRNLDHLGRSVQGL